MRFKKLRNGICLFPVKFKVRIQVICLTMPYDELFTEWFYGTILTPSDGATFTAKWHHCFLATNRYPFRILYGHPIWEVSTTSLIALMKRCNLQIGRI